MALSNVEYLKFKLLFWSVFANFFASFEPENQNEDLDQYISISLMLLCCISWWFLNFFKGQGEALQKIKEFIYNIYDSEDRDYHINMQQKQPMFGGLSGKVLSKARFKVWILWMKKISTEKTLFQVSSLGSNCIDLAQIGLN